VSNVVGQGSGSGIFQGTKLSLAWKVWKKARETSFRIVGNPARFEPNIFRIQAEGLLLLLLRHQLARQYKGDMSGIFYFILFVGNELLEIKFRSYLASVIIVTGQSIVVPSADVFILWTYYRWTMISSLFVIALQTNKN